MTCFQKTKFKINKWTDSEELNPLKVDRLSYRSATDTILDFIAQGYLLNQQQEHEYSDDVEDNNLSENYFEDTSRSIDNLLDVKEAFDALNEQGNPDLSTTQTKPANDKAKAESEVVEKSENSEVK